MDQNSVPNSEYLLWLALLGSLLTLAALASRGSRRAKKRARRAVRGEENAKRLLKAHGYAILDNQAVHSFPVVADGDRIKFEIRADFLVKRGRHVYVAEVKTGNLAPNLSHGATRRQLLEYALAYEARGVLLVTPGNGQIRRIEFPRLTRYGQRGRFSSFLLGSLFGAGMFYIMTEVFG